MAATATITIIFIPTKVYRLRIVVATEVFLFFFFPVLPIRGPFHHQQFKDVPVSYSPNL